MIGPPRIPPLFPYTTLFRSGRADEGAGAGDALVVEADRDAEVGEQGDRKSTRLNSSHMSISYAVFCLKKKQNHANITNPRPLCKREGDSPDDVQRYFWI